MQTDLIIALAIFIVSFLLVTLLRKKIGKDYEIKNTDILIGIVPLALWLLLTGKITNFEYGDLKISSAFAQANKQPITGTITQIYKKDIPSMDKRTYEELERILRAKPVALNFYSGQDRYSADVIEKYLIQLSASSLQYLIIKNPDDAFIGMLKVDLFMAQTLSDNPSVRPFEFARWLNEGENNRLNALDGFIGKEHALTETVSKIEALEKMETLNTQYLPVVSRDKFVGIIEKDQLSTSLLMDISKNLNEE